jgi:hypothetical protein
MTKPKTTDTSIALLALASRLRTEHDFAKRDLLGSIEYLTVGLRRAKEALDKGEKIDAHLIANAVMMTESIARWNTALELDPFVVAALKDKEDA